MRSDPAVEELAGELLVGIGLLVRRLRQTQVEHDLTMPETSALARLDRAGPTTSAAMAKLEQISPQSMGATLGSLEARGLIERNPDPDDGRRAVISVTKAGLKVLRNRRNARTERLARSLSREFTRSELKQLVAAAPLIERLGQSI